MSWTVRTTDQVKRDAEVVLEHVPTGYDVAHRTAKDALGLLNYVGALQLASDSLDRIAEALRPLYDGAPGISDEMFREFIQDHPGDVARRITDLASRPDGEAGPAHADPLRAPAPSPDGGAS